MDIVFEVIDKNKRKIYLSKETWRHIRKRHPEINNFEEIKEALINPTKITGYNLDETIIYYYKYFKYKKSPEKYLLVIVKYLNTRGFVITAYFEKIIK